MFDRGNTRGAFSRLLRRALMGVALVLPLGLSAMPAKAQASAAAQAVADHFSSVGAMTGDFMQFDPNGKQSEGKFYIERPGKLRFDYSGTPLRVIADGSQVAINNRKLNTWDLYPLSKTPLKLLLNERIDLSAANIQDVKEEPDLTTIVMGDKSFFGDQTITLMFDPKTYDLRQWTITDAQAKDTSVMIFNVQTGVQFDEKVFTVPYDDVRNKGRGG